MYGSIPIKMSKLSHLITSNRSTYWTMTAHTTALFFHSPVKSDIMFAIHNNGLHYYGTKLQEVALMDTVEYNSKGYSKYQLNNSKLAWYIYAKIGHPSICY